MEDRRKREPERDEERKEGNRRGEFEEGSWGREKREFGGFCYGKREKKKKRKKMRSYEGRRDREERVGEEIYFS